MPRRMLYAHVESPRERLEAHQRILDELLAIEPPKDPHELAIHKGSIEYHRDGIRIIREQLAHGYYTPRKHTP